MSREKLLLGIAHELLIRQELNEELELLVDCFFSYLAKYSIIEYINFSDSSADWTMLLEIKKRDSDYLARGLVNFIPFLPKTMTLQYYLHVVNINNKALNCAREKQLEPEV